MFWYVYVLLCSDKKPYTGCTDDLKNRLQRHEKGYVFATKQRRPIRLIAYFALQDKYAAYQFERYLKSGSGRVFMKRHILAVPVV